VSALPLGLATPERLVAKCASCEEVLGMIEPSDRAYGRAPLLFCGEKCLNTWVLKRMARRGR